MQTKLTPFDAETLAMIESLTGRETVTTRFDDHFTIHAFYTEHRDPDYINAIISAVRGRMGKRFIEVQDDPDRAMLKFTIAFDKQNLPDVEGFTDIVPARLESGEIYCRTVEQIRAIQVRRDNYISVAEFCGNGTIQIERHPGGKAWFTFLNNGTYVDVPENDYIVRRKNTNAFEIWPKAKFEKEWERK